MKRRAVFVRDQMKLPGVLLWFTGCLKLHKDGDGVGGVFRVWHPVTWLLLVLMVVPCAIFGEELLRVVPLRLSDFWKNNMDQFQPVTPFTRLSTLKPFVHNIRVPKEAAQ